MTDSIKLPPSHMTSKNMWNKFLASPPTENGFLFNLNNLESTLWPYLDSTGLDSMYSLEDEKSEVINVVSWQKIVRQYFKVVLKQPSISHTSIFGKFPITCGETAFLSIRKNHKRRCKKV
jgi:hypothetical protein